MSNLDLDDELINHLAIEDSVLKLKGEQVSLEVIEDADARKVFNWQMEHLREHGAAATAAVLQDQFPKISLAQPETAVGDLVERLRRRFARNEARTVVYALGKLANDDPMMIASTMMTEARRLTGITTKRGDSFSNGDFPRALRGYDERILRGAGPSLGFEEIDEHFNGQLGVTFLLAPPKTYKALALDTPIPVPGGWATMGELQVGDEVFDQNGSRCRVLGKSPVWDDRPCYRVSFSDGTSIVADAEHLWETNRRDHGVGVRTTQEIHVTLLRSDNGYNHSIPVADALECDEKRLNVDPYVLGAWLGDGTGREAAITSADPEVLDSIRAAGHTLTKWANKYAYGVSDLQSHLRALGVLNNKHIPDEYLRASYGQRLALMQGLMDTDGSCSVRGDATFVTTSPALRDNVLELARSLGLKPVANEYRATLHGVDHGPKWHVRFRAYADQPVFRIARKLSRQVRRPDRPARSRTRQIVAVDPVESVPVQCITVDSERHLYLAGEGMTPTHNSWATVKAVTANVMAGRKAYLYSLELPAIETEMRVACMMADVPYWRYLKGRLSNEDRRRLKEGIEIMEASGTRFIEKPAPGERNVIRLVERAMNAGADVIFIDQLQYLETRKGVNVGAANNTGDYWEVCNDLRDYSDQVPIFVVHQFNRSVMGSKGFPEMQQAKGSSAIEEVATLALGLWASKEMRQNNEVEIGTLASRNYSYRNWRLRVNLSNGCDLAMIGVVEDEEA